MLMPDIIAKKRDGGELSTEEINYVIAGCTNGSIPDYQLSALLMAIVWRGMNLRETCDLTMAMVHSGDVLDLSPISGIKADKHSTGGVGDKTSLALLPMVASQGVKMAKMSGRGLGHTGGTLDKLESFKGFSSSLELGDFMRQVDKTGLRDVTGTVASLPLIVSSIMSKKLAAGADVIVLDVKCGGGAFMKTFEDAETLAREMVSIGKMTGRRTVACITDMEQPLGRAVGNALEVAEALALLRGEFGGELLELCLTLGSCILTEAGVASSDAEARERLMHSIESGAALEKMAEFVRAQGGDDRAVHDPTLLPKAPVVIGAKAEQSGYVNHIDAEGVGLVSMHLGGGRATKGAEIDLSVGLLLEKKVGDRVERGDTLAYIHARDAKSAAEAAEKLAAAYTISDEPPARGEFIKGIIR